jgi:hypothetical protein
MNLSWKSNTTVNVSPALTPSRPASDSSKVATIDLSEANTLLPVPASAANDADSAVNTPAAVHDGTSGSVPNMYDLDDLPDLIVESDKNKTADDDDDILPAPTSGRLVFCLIYCKS